MTMAKKGRRRMLLWRFCALALVVEELASSGRILFNIDLVWNRQERREQREEYKQRRKKRWGNLMMRERRKEERRKIETDNRKRKKKRGYLFIDFQPSLRVHWIVEVRKLHPKKKERAKPRISNLTITNSRRCFAYSLEDWEGSTILLCLLFDEFSVRCRDLPSFRLSSRFFSGKPTTRSSLSFSSLSSIVFLIQLLISCFVLNSIVVDVTKLPMPALSPTMDKGNLASWNKKVCLACFLCPFSLSTDSINLSLSDPSNFFFFGKKGWRQSQSRRSPCWGWNG